MLRLGDNGLSSLSQSDLKNKNLKKNVKSVEHYETRRGQIRITATFFITQDVTQFSWLFHQRHFITCWVVPTTPSAPRNLVCWTRA